MDDNVGDSGQFGGLQISRDVPTGDLRRAARCSCGMWTVPAGVPAVEAIDLKWHRRPPAQCEDQDDPASLNPADTGGLTRAELISLPSEELKARLRAAAKPVEPVIQPTPNLGLATTEQLMNELITRMELSTLKPFTQADATNITHNSRNIGHLRRMLSRMDLGTRMYRTTEA